MIRDTTLKRGVLENRFMNAKQDRINEVMETNQKMALQKKVQQENLKRERYLSEIQKLDLLRTMQMDRPYEGEPECGEGQ